VGRRRVRTEQRVILIDATSIPGASGSPVFLGPGVRAERGSQSLFATRPWLLGVMHGFYTAPPRELDGIQVSTVVPAFAENSGIAIVFPSWRLLEILERDDVVKRIQAIADNS